MTVSNLTRKGVLELLDNNSQLKTPSFQRSYAWGADQVDDFLDDIYRGMNQSGVPTDHFLGLVVIDAEGHIQDGQQRLATTVLLASEIYLAAEAAKVSPHTATLAVDVLGKVTPCLRSDPQAALQISVQDQGALLQRTGIRSSARESTRRLIAARKRIDERLAVDLNKCTTSDEKLRRLLSWASYLRGGAYVVALTVPVRQAHTIFETLNTRGVRLSNGDLLKSYLIARATNTTEAVEKWKEVTVALEDDDLNFEKDLETFLLHYYGSKYGKSVKRELFSDYRSHLDAADPITIIEQLRDNAKLYRALVEPAEQESFWSRFGAGTREAISLVNGLGLKQLRYLLLAVMRDLAANEAEAKQYRRRGEAIRKIAAWSVRSLVHNKTGGGDAEAVYIDLAAQVREQKSTTVADLRQFMIERKMIDRSDAYFIQEFKAFNFDSRTSHNRARAILYALEYHSSKSSAAMVTRGTLTVEHVLPQSREAGQWTDFDDDEAQIFAYKLGNLLLIDGPSGANNRLGNKPWQEKQKLIAEFGTQTPLTTLALKKRKWTKQTISMRHDELAALAAEAFAL